MIPRQIPVRFIVDSPARKGTLFYDVLVVSGWFIDAEGRPARRVHAQIGRERVACERVSRPDVYAYLGEAAPATSHIGFQLCLKRPPGVYSITVEIETASGEILHSGRAQARLASWKPHVFKGTLGWLNARYHAWKWRRPPQPSDSVLILVPFKRGTRAALVTHARSLADRAAGHLPHARIVFDDRGAAPTRGAHIGRQSPLAQIRQSMIDDHLRAEKWVFWADVDLVDYPADLIASLIRRADGGIAAPLVLMEGPSSPTGHARFFDTAGFIEKGGWANPFPPYFQQPGPVYRLDSVGCCYLVAADLYRQGARYEVDPLSRRLLDSNEPWPHDETLAGEKGGGPLAFTEHYSVCAFARRQGRPVRAFGDLVAVHEATL